MNTVSNARPGTGESPLMLLVESRSPWESGDVGDFLDMARCLLASGNAVHLHLIQNGVLWLRRDANALQMLRSDSAGRVRISCDEFSLAQRGIPLDLAQQHGDVWATDALVAEMAGRGVKTIWHS
ncbi:hypothetical protein P3W85_20675 [Cupriavidus basilensis]|uniref:DsrE family protein n=1 Tax=Cupriavidus basilensis TaxID=68895 RepID=A0ABT6ARU9_9BURK|nr:hypothetical protein [Cupriavidus basilensis]MDF3835351.1 hypothetical protein [Cupriavidus basilensis]